MFSSFEPGNTPGGAAVWDIFGIEPWYFISALTVIGVLIIWKMFGKKGKVANNPFAQKVPLIDQFLLLVFGGVVLSIGFVVLWLTLDGFGKAVPLERALGISDAEANIRVVCDTADDIHDKRVAIKRGDGTTLSICGIKNHGHGFIIFKPDGNYRLEFQIASKFKSDNIEVLTTRSVHDFLKITEPGFAGSTVNSYRVMLKHDAFTESGLENLVFHVKVVRR